MFQPCTRDGQWLTKLPHPVHPLVVRLTGGGLWATLRAVSEPAALESKLLTFVTDTFLFGQRGDLTAQTMLLEKGIVDSTGVLELVVFIEEACGFKVADADLVPENFGSVARLCQYVERRGAS